VSFHPLVSWAVGNIILTKKGKVKLTIELPLDQLGSPYKDIRAIISGHCEANTLVPLIAFVEPKVVIKELGTS
jgi:hypothetical protein